MQDEIIREEPGHVRLRVTPRLWAILQAHRISFGTRAPANLPHLDLPKTARVEQYADYSNGLTMFSMGALSYTMTAESAWTVSRYCSIADLATVMGERHPVEHALTSTFPYRARRPSFRWAREDLLAGSQRLVPPGVPTPAMPVLQHDVWIGNRAILARGITLHTGCIVGAGAVVTRDVPPYAIVGGNPASIIRLRFAEPIIARLLASRWWDCHPRILFDCDIRDPARFLDQLDAVRDTLPAFAPSVFTWDVLQRELAG